MFLGSIIHLIIWLSAFWIAPFSVSDNETVLGRGSQPAITIDKLGTIRVVYGVKDGQDRKIYFVSSTDDGRTFSKPELIGSFPQMGLGMGRGPQMATTKDYTVITVGDHRGGLYSISTKNGAGSWTAPRKINDADTTAKEALSGLGAGQNNELYTVWLDTRLGNNTLFGARSNDGGLSWSRSRLVYKGEENGVCDCCKPSIRMGNNGVAHVMFRNKLEGARNIYLIKSHGDSLGTPQKLGNGNFMINACPMDGGDISIDEKDDIVTVWRRQNEIFLSRPGKEEVKLGEGRTPVVARTGSGPLVVWEQQGTLNLWTAHNSKTVSLTKGQYPKLALSDDRKAVFCVFEREGQIALTRIPL
ncbi:MAG: exo-alpha-sialidase [Dyadobacter sp.]|uniref:sialidase family protein n=1 Tax=Dyadobacter sp. TaxID=1914288 RepID=UPI001B2E56FE|nr:sialidase family protein [Dyadobacter sp.]MBO9616852.1 exo-alpha-sialidase [Dyadobacter sp.]